MQGTIAHARRFCVAVLFGLALEATRSLVFAQALSVNEPTQGEEGASDGEPRRVPMIAIVRRSFEPSYLAYPIVLSGLPSLLVESNVAAHFVVHRHSWPFAFVLTPKFVVRMLRERSTPVRSPSYMPRIAVFAWLTRELSPGEVTGYASLTLSHHSNGQKGPALDEHGNNNREDGDFSTNFVELAVYETRADRAVLGWNKLALEWHLDVNRSAGLEGRYGLVRAKLATTLFESTVPLEAALTLQVSAILDDFAATSQTRLTRALERFPLAVQYTVKVPGIDLGAYVGYYLGHDYYNIWFDRVVNAFQVGVSGAVGVSSCDSVCARQREVKAVRRRRSLRPSRVSECNPHPERRSRAACTPRRSP